MKTIFYLASDVFTKGGIERYSQYQIRAIGELLPEYVLRVFSVNPPRENAFESLIDVFHQGRGLSLHQKIGFVFKVLQETYLQKPDLIWCNHLRLLPIAFLSKVFSPKSSIFVNIYGLEVWSGLRFIDKLLLRNTQTVISDSHFTAQYVIDHLNIPEHHLQVIWDPVDTTRFKPLEIDQLSLLKKYNLPSKEDSMWIMTLGRISTGSRHKGYDRLIDLMHKLKTENINLVICGDGNDRERLVSRVNGEGLNENVFFSGSIMEEDLEKIYQLADVFILISDRGKNRGEGVPLTPLEAASCGKPIIVGDEDGSQEAVMDGVNGYIISPRDPEGLKEKVLQLYEDSERRVKMGQNARKYIIDEFSYQMFKKRHQVILEQLSK